MSAANRKRGHRAELNVAAWFRDHGYPDAETTRARLGHDGAHAPGDVIAVPGLVIEVKDVAASAWPTWCRQAEAEANGRPWVVIRRLRGTPDVGAWHALDSDTVNRSRFPGTRPKPITLAEFMAWWECDAAAVGTGEGTP